MIEEFDLKKLTGEISETDCFTKVFNYNQSEKNLKNCEPFKQLNLKYLSLQKQYINSYKELSKDIESKVYRREYAKGGEGIHRGFHSPSLMDLVVGGVNRGRLLKKPPKDNNYNYEYLFDAQNNMICVYSYNNYNGMSEIISTEFFIYQQNKILSLVFNTDHGLSFMSECQYENGRLIRYENVLCDMFNNGKDCIEINLEIHEYADDLLHSFCWYRYKPSMHLLTQEKYSFARDKEGYLSTYTVDSIGGYRPQTNSYDEKVIYNVRVKRK